MPQRFNQASFLLGEMRPVRRSSFSVEIILINRGGKVTVRICCYGILRSLFGKPLSQKTKWLLGRGELKSFIEMTFLPFHSKHGEFVNRRKQIDSVKSHCLFEQF